MNSLYLQKVSSKDFPTNNMKRTYKLIIDIILISLSTCSIAPIIFKNIEIDSIIARVAISCALIANTYFLSEHKMLKNSLFIIALALTIINTSIYIYL